MPGFANEVVGEHANDNVAGRHANHDIVAGPATIQDATEEFFRHNATSFAIYAILLTVMAIERVGVPHFYGKLIDAVRKAEFNRVYWLFGLLVFIFMLFQLIDTCLTVMDADLMPRFESTMRMFMTERIVAQMKEAYSELELGDITSKLIKLPAHMRTLFQRCKVFSFNHVLSILFSAAYLFYCHWSIGAIFSVNFLVITITTYLFCTRCAQRSCTRETTFDAAQEGIQDILYNLMSVYNSHTEHAEHQRVTAYNADVNVRTRDYVMCGLPYRIVLAVCFVSIFAGCTLAGIWLYQRQHITLAILISSFIVAFAMLRTCMSFYFDFDSFIYVYGGIKVVDDFLKRLPLPPPRVSAVAHTNDARATLTTTSPPHISLREVTYVAKNQRVVVSDITFDIRPYTRTVITGRIGSGKSTVAKLIVRLIRPTSGRVLIDDVDANQLSIATLRRIIYYSPQTPRLFNRTLYENLVYGNETTCTEHDIYALLHALELFDLERVFRSKMHKVVGKNAHRLSGGQQQIVVLIRAYFYKARVYIFDEPTSALDRESRQNVLRMIDHMGQNATIVLVTHDDDLIRKSESSSTIIRIR